MTTKNATVTEGYTYTPDSSGTVQLTWTRANLQAKPTVVVDLKAIVDTEDLKDAVADKILTGSATVGTESANNIDVVLQLKDAQGNDLAEICVVEYWISNTSTGGPDVTTFPDGGCSATVGADITVNADDVVGRGITSSSGTLTIRYVHAGGALSGLYFCAIINNKLVQGSAELSWS